MFLCPCSGMDSLLERIYEVCAERDSLKGRVGDYERARQAIGLEQTDRILEAACRWEQISAKPISKNGHIGILQIFFRKT